MTLNALEIIDNAMESSKRRADPCVVGIKINSKGQITECSYVTLDVDKDKAIGDILLEGIARGQSAKSKYDLVNT